MMDILDRLRDAVFFMVTDKVTAAHIPTKHIQVMDDAYDEIVRLRDALDKAMNNWTFFAYARLGRIRGSMSPEDVEAVQNFLERALPSPTPARSVEEG